VETATPLAAVTVAEGLAVSEVAFYQTVKIAVSKDGADVSPYNAQLITNRKGMIRAFTTVLNKRFKPRFLTAELHLVPQTGTEIVLTDNETLAASFEEDTTTTFNFAYDENTLSFGMQAWLRVVDPKMPSDAIRYPSSGTIALDVTKNPGRVRARLVPIAYKADNSGRLPDTSDAQLDRIKTELMDLYPTNEIDIDVRTTPIDGLMTVDPGGNGWMELLQAVVDTRAADMPPNDMYYVGWFQPRQSFFQYCQGGCIVGLATTADPAVPSERAVLAVGYTGNSSAETVAHEIGHTMGRHHAPCGGAQGIDAKFPYADGSTGVPGWRQSDKSFVFEASDIMGYCQPFWISDYTYKALANRITVVNAAGLFPQPAQHDVQRILIAPDGTLAVSKSLRMDDVVGGNPVVVKYFDGRSLVATAPGRRFGYDHLPGGMILVMDPPKVAFTRVAL